MRWCTSSPAATRWSRRPSCPSSICSCSRNAAEPDRHQREQKVGHQARRAGVVLRQTLAEEEADEDERGEQGADGGERVGFEEHEREDAGGAEHPGEDL